MNHEFVLGGWKVVEGVKRYLLRVEEGMYLCLTPADDVFQLSAYFPGVELTAFDEPVAVDIGPYRKEIDLLLPEVVAGSPDAYATQALVTGSRERATRRLGEICLELASIDNGEALHD